MVVFYTSAGVGKKYINKNTFVCVCVCVAYCHVLKICVLEVRRRCNLCISTVNIELANVGGESEDAPFILADKSCSP